MAAYLGLARVPTVAGPVEIEWSLDALADLDRFAAFLHGQFPELAGRVAGELIARADVLSRHPKLGRPIKHREEYREIVFQVLGGTYALQYRYDGSSVLMLRLSSSDGTAKSLKPQPARDWVPTGERLAHHFFSRARSLV